MENRVLHHRAGLFPDALIERKRSGLSDLDLHEIGKRFFRTRRHTLVKKSRRNQFQDALGACIVARAVTNLQLWLCVLRTKYSSGQDRHPVPGENRVGRDDGEVVRQGTGDDDAVTGATLIRLMTG